MSSNRFQTHFQFALHKENSEIRQDIPINQMEKFGNWLSWMVYDFRKMVVKIVTDPRYITLFFTTFFMILTALLFYPSYTWELIERFARWLVLHIEWKYVRFCLWFISEVTVLGLGMRAFGRFSNAQLMKFHGIA